MERQKVSEIARKLGVSCQSVYKKLSKGDNRLTPHVTKEGNATFLDEEGIGILAEMFGKQDGKPVSPVVTPVETLLKEQLREKQEIINTLFREREEDRQRAAEERQRTDTILMKLTTDISNLQKALEYKKPDTAVTSTEKENRDSSKSQDRRADPRQVVLPPVEKREPVQRELSLWESVQLTINDFTGLLFGRG